MSTGSSALTGVTRNTAGLGWEWLSFLWSIGNVSTALSPPCCAGDGFYGGSSHSRGRGAQCWPCLVVLDETRVAGPVLPYADGGFVAVGERVGACEGAGVKTFDIPNVPSCDILIEFEGARERAQHVLQHWEHPCGYVLIKGFGILECGAQARHLSHIPRPNRAVEGGGAQEDGGHKYGALRLPL